MLNSSITGACWMSIVCKFGGTSIRDASHIDNALEIMDRRLAAGAVLVASAIDKTTDAIVQLLEMAQQGGVQSMQQCIAEIRRQHLAISQHIAQHSAIFEQCNQYIHTHISSLEQAVASYVDRAARQEPPAKLEAAILAHGELLSNAIVYSFARAKGYAVTLLDSRQLIITDSNYLKATPDLPTTLQRISAHIKPASNHLYIVPGYISANRAGETTTLGRGGSDYSAALLGAALQAHIVEIWTDVDGIMTTDPRMVTAARTVPAISYPEAAELAYFGARVIHPSTILPAIRKKIPISVRNSSRPEAAGTIIQPEERDAPGVCAIATKSSITIVTMQSYRMLNAYGFLSRIFAVFAQYHIPVDIVTTSEVSVSVTVESQYNIRAARNELEHFCNVEVDGDYSIICLVGQNLWGDSFTIARTFRVLQHVPVRLISLGSSDTNLTLVVEHQNMSRAIQLLHREYFENSSANDPLSSHSNL